MDWSKFNTHGESKERAFEILVNQIFKTYCEKQYVNEFESFVTINGAGGDGGIEAYANLNNGKIIAIQSKCFFDVINSSRLTQIEKSIDTALKVRNNIEKYIVCVPRDLANKKNKIKNSEREKIEKIFKKFSSKNVKFELWGEFEILDFFTRNEELNGVYKFWFDNSDISFNSIIKNFEIQKYGWLKGRYEEELHTDSCINYEIRKLMGDNEYLKKKINEVLNLRKAYDDYIKMFEKFIEVLDEIDKKNIIKIYRKQKIDVKKINENLVLIEGYLKNENSKVNFENSEIKIEFDWFYDIKDKYIMKIHCLKMENCIKVLIGKKRYSVLNEIKKDYLIKNLVIVGDLGTGKTHSVVNQIENELNKKNIAILIRASDIKDKLSWRDILINKLGLSNSWLEEELFEALNSLAYKNELDNKNEITIKNKILICIDGIDEHTNYSFWEEKRNEAIYYTQKYDRLRFCFIGREYAFENLKEIDNNIFKIIKYGINPGYDIDEMYKKYIDKFNIKFKNSINVKSFLNNPLALKLFCEQYRNREINSLNNVKVNLSQLFGLKLEQMNKEFRKKNTEVLCDDAISRAATLIVEYLYNNEKILRRDVIKFMDEDDELCCLDSNTKMKIIKSLMEYGLLTFKESMEELGKRLVYYYRGMQPVIDYIISRELADDIYRGVYDKIEKFKKNFSILKMASLILYEDYNIYLPDLNILNLDEYKIIEITSYILINSNPIKTKKMVKKIREWILMNPNNMRIILNEVIIPGSRIENHPLGSTFLDEILCSYTNMAERDKIWSLPDRLIEEKNYIGEELIINEKNPNCFLNKDDTYTGLPIIYGWLLSKTSQNDLLFYRNQLMKWAIMCPKEFVLLLIKFSSINDIQILEQLYSIAMCLCYKVNDIEIVNRIFDICKKNFFSDDKILTYDFQIRTYIRAIAEKAYKYKIISKKELKKFIPPYKCDKEIKLYKDAYDNGTRMNGYGNIITYDLARYVLCDYLEYRFFHCFDNYNNYNNIKLNYVFTKDELLLKKDLFEGNNEYEEALKSFDTKNKLEDILIDYDINKIEDKSSHLKNNVLNKKNYRENYYGKKTYKFLKNEIKKINALDISSDKYIIAGAYQYILNCGWNKDEFYYNQKIDCDILSNYYAATHGGKSTVMCFAEKYIWCYRNEIVGYLADNLYKNKEETEQYTNYAEIDDVLIPIVECEQISNEENDYDGDYAKEDIFKFKKLRNIEEIKKWINKSDFFIKLEELIYVNNSYGEKYITLDRFDSFSDLQNDIEVNLWLTSGIINERDMKYLKDNIEHNQNYLYKTIYNIDNFKEYTITDGAKTPLEIINFDWYNRDEERWENISLLDNLINKYSIFKTFENPYNLHTKFTEVHYKIPGFKIRKILKINDNDEFYYKSNNKIVAFYRSNNKSWDDYHNILAVNRKLENGLRKNNEKMLWFFRMEKTLNSLGKEKYKDVYNRTDIIGVCWFENEKIKKYFLKNISDN